MRLLIRVIAFLVVPLQCIDISKVEKNGRTFFGRTGFTFRDGRPYSAYYNIRYADPPLGPLRFKPPRESPLNNGTYDFTKDNEDHYTRLLNEDCLYLSIFVPVQHQTLPVMVWVHEQSYNHGPDFLLEENVIVVKVSYRTGIFGFLDTGDDFAHGNIGAKDIVAALKWLKEYLPLFNGDPNRITVFGSGESATIVASLLVSPLSLGLFARVIVQSGSALSAADYNNYQFEIAHKLYWRLTETLEKINKTKLYEMLMEAPTEQLSAISYSLFDSTEVRDSQRLINSFGPSVETKNSDPFMIKAPVEVYNRQMSNKNVEVMIGYTNLESLHKVSGLAANRQLLRYLNYNFQYLLPFEGKSDEFGSKRYKKIRKLIMDFYFLNGTITERSFRRYVNYMADQKIYPVLRQAELHAEASFTNVFLYRFSHNGSFNLGKRYLDDNLNVAGATSDDEVCYIFRCKSANYAYNEAEAKEIEFIKRIVKLWTNFAKFGNPTPVSKQNNEDNFIWKALSQREDVKVMRLRKNMKMTRIPENKRKEFWDQLREEFFTEKAFHDEL